MGSRQIDRPGTWIDQPDPTGLKIQQLNGLTERNIEDGLQLNGPVQCPGNGIQNLKVLQTGDGRVGIGQSNVGKMIDEKMKQSMIAAFPILQLLI